MIIGGSSSQDLAASVARELGEKLCYVETRKFPDGERYLRISESVENEEVTVIQSTGYPQDENLMELIFMIANLKDLGAKKVRVVVPYMGYARQEKRFNPGETISAKIVCEMIESAGADEFITFNIHEKCVLDFFNIPARNISAMPDIADYLNKKFFKKEDAKPLIIAPDKGAYGFAQEISEIIVPTGQKRRCRNECQSVYRGTSLSYRTGGIAGRQSLRDRRKRGQVTFPIFRKEGNDRGRMCRTGQCHRLRRQRLCCFGSHFPDIFPEAAR